MVLGKREKGEMRSETIPTFCGGKVDQLSLSKSSIDPSFHDARPF